MKSLLIGFLLCGVAIAQSKSTRIFLDTADPSQPSTVTIGYLAPSHGEQIRMLNQYCPNIQITDDPQKAELILRWESKTWQQTSWSGHQQEFTLYSLDKDVLGSGAAHHIKNAAKDICKLIQSKATAPPSQAAVSH